MSRELGPVEARVCRIVITLLGITVLVFVVLSAIDFLFNPSPRPRTPQSQPMVQASPKETQTAQYRKTPRRGVLPNHAAAIALPKKEMPSPPPQSGLEKIIRFDAGLLDRRVDAASLADADALLNMPPAGRFQSGPQQEIFTAVFASAEPALAYRSQEPVTPSPAPNMQDQPAEPSLGTATSSREDVQQIQSRLRDLGYLSSAVTGMWDVKSREALRDFKLVNGLAPNDTLDPETSEKLNAPAAIRAHQSLLGRWSSAPCNSAKTTDTRITITSHRVRLSTGSVCEFNDLKRGTDGWRVRASCSQDKKHWAANGKFALKGDKLVWTSERDVISYFRCN